jgi:(p)ppGpp synthase/HD superfamily hydrolase
MSFEKMFCFEGQRHPTESDLEGKARRFANVAHVTQIRKYTMEPYIYHPAEVADIVRTVPHDEEMLAAAWLHDVVEDCGVKGATIWNEFGSAVCFMVMQLTDVSRPSDGRREVRKRIDREHSARSCPGAQTVKLADIISNSKNILANDENFSKIYLPEKRELLRVLTKGDQELWDQADKICREAGY